MGISGNRVKVAGRSGGQSFVVETLLVAAQWAPPKITGTVGHHITALITMHFTNVVPIAPTLAWIYDLCAFEERWSR